MNTSPSLLGPTLRYQTLQLNKETTFISYANSQLPSSKRTGLFLNLVGVSLVGGSGEREETPKAISLRIQYISQTNFGSSALGKMGQLA